MKLGTPGTSLAKRFLRRVALPAAERAIGRANVVRLTRFVSYEVMLDGPNDINQNGETLVQRSVLAAARGPLTVVDVGANVGDWVAAFDESARTASRTDYALHAFEPCTSTRHTLEAKVRQLGLEARVTIHGTGVSSRNGTTEFYVVGEGIGINSVHPPHDVKHQQVEIVSVETLDNFAQKAGIHHIQLLKSDVEGHDIHVLRGASSLLARRAIDVVQFEYTWRWIEARAYLRDVFDLCPPGYGIGKVTRLGVEWYPSWTPDLETFREGNYMLCRHECQGWFPALRWWHLD